MTDHWQDNEISSAQVKGDDDDAPDDWEAQLEEKPKVVETEEKPKPVTKASTTTKNKATTKFTDEEESSKIIHQPDGDYTPEQLDEIQKKEELKKEHDKLDMVTELVDKNGEHVSLDNLNLITRDEFLNYSLRLYNQLGIVSKSEFYPDFIDNFLEGITKSMSTDGVKRLSATLQAISIRKVSDEREKKAKSKAKKQGKPQLKTGRRADYVAFGDDVDNDFDPDVDYDDDFM